MAVRAETDVRQHPRGSHHQDRRGQSRDRIHAKGDSTMKRVAARIRRVARGAALIAIAIGVMVSGRAQTPVESDLDKLEAALAAAPDDLRVGNDYRMAVIA